MQFVSLPILTFVKPVASPPSMIQVISAALALDFKKYLLAMAFNELSQSEKDDKKSQNAQTNIQSISLQDIIQGKCDQNEVEPTKKNRKTESIFEISSKDNQKIGLQQPKKRQSFERARSQITQALQSSSQSEEVVDSSNDQKEEQISFKNKTESKIDLKGTIRKQKKIKKPRKVIKYQQKISGEPSFQISTTVSLIDTIDHPRIAIDRFQIQDKKYNLLSRAIVYDQLEQKKFSYQIRERRELKKLN